MFTIYTLFKFLHVAGAIVWIGAVLTTSILGARLAREKDGSALALLSRQGRFLGRAVMGPAALTTLIAGMVMVAVAGMGAPLWIIWGLVGVFGSLTLGVGFINRTSSQLGELAKSASPGDPRLHVLQRRMAALNILNLLLLFSTVWAMVFKPGM